MLNELNFWIITAETADDGTLIDTTYQIIRYGECATVILQIVNNTVYLNQRTLS